MPHQPTERKHRLPRAPAYLLAALVTLALTGCQDPAVVFVLRNDTERPILLEERTCRRYIGCGFEPFGIAPLPPGAVVNVLAAPADGMVLRLSNASGAILGCLVLGGSGDRPRAGDVDRRARALLASAAADCPQ